MKSFIFGKRGKRLVALCLVILQVLFQFPVEWKAEGKPKKKDIELHFLFKDNEQNPAQATKVEVELVIYKQAEEAEKEEAEEKELSSSVMDEDEEEKVSASFFEDEGKEKTSSSTSGIEQDDNYTKKQASWDRNDGFPHFYSNSKYSEDNPSSEINQDYGIVQEVLFYTGQTNQDGEIFQKIPANYMATNYTIEIRVRGSNESYETNGVEEYTIHNGVLTDDLEEIVELKLSKRQKKKRQGKLILESVSELSMKDGASVNFAVHAEYIKPDNDSEPEPIPKINYYITDSDSNKKRIQDPNFITVDSPVSYTIIAEIPEDEHYLSLERTQVINVRSNLSNEILLEKEISKSFSDGDFINPTKMVPGKVHYTIPSGVNLNEIPVKLEENGTKIRVIKPGTVILKVTVDPWKKNHKIYL